MNDEHKTKQGENNSVPHAVRADNGTLQPIMTAQQRRHRFSKSGRGYLASCRLFFHLIRDRALPSDAGGFREDFLLAFS